MQYYHFALQSNGSRIEELGSMTLPNDGEAIAFGERIVRDLMDSPNRAGVAVAIIKGKRTVRSIPLLEKSVT